MASLVQYIERSSPRQAEIVDHLRGRIVAGEFSPGSQLPSVAQIVEQFGASNTTVQRALAHLREAGYVSSVKSRGTYVSENPPHLCHLGVVYDRPMDGSMMSCFHNAFRAETARMSEQETHPDGLSWRFSHYYGSQGFAAPKERSALIHAVESRQFAGLIFLGEPADLLKTPVVQQESLPKVVVGHMPGMPSINMNIVALREKALDYLLARGRKRVAFTVCCDFDQPVGKVCDALMPLVEARGMTTHRYWIQGASLRMRDWAANSMELLMHSSRRDRPDGLVILDDNFVPGVTAVLVTAGVDVPRDLEVVAHCNFPYPTHAAVPVVRLGFDISKLLDTCVELIERRIRHEDVAEELTIEPVFETGVAG